MDASTQTVEVRDVEMQVVRVGGGSPLLISGGPQLGHHYLRSLDAVADVREVIYYDARGTGRTPLGDPAQLTFAGAVADLEALRAALGIGQMDLLGHSLGGHTAYLYAAMYPQQVRSLILVDVGPPLTAELAMELGAAMQGGRTVDDDAALRRIGESQAFQDGEPKAAEAYILNIYTPFFSDRRAVASIDLGFTDLTAANVLDYEETLVASLPAQDPFEALGRISCPTLVLHGQRDPIPLDFARMLAERIAGAQLAIVPGAGHFPFIEEPEAFRAIVKAFLASVRARTRP